MTLRKLLLALILALMSVACARADWLPTFSGDVSNAGPGSPLLTIANGAVTAAKMASGAAAANLGYTPLNPANLGATAFTATGGTASATPANRAGHLLNAIDDFNAICNGSTNDTTALTAAAASGAIVIPGATTLCNSTFSLTSIPSTLGPGQILDASANARAPNTVNLSSYPATVGNWASAETAFIGSLPLGGKASQLILSGSASVPAGFTSGYSTTPEVSLTAEDFYNASGLNYSTTGNGGRTGNYMHYMRLDQYGAGDQNLLGCNGIVASTKAGPSGSSTVTGIYGYLANPEIACMAGELFGGANGAFIELIGDLDANDNGYDMAVVGLSNVYYRANATENVGANWIDHIIQSKGADPTDAITRASGPMVEGFDLANVTMGYWRLASFTASGGAGFAVGDKVTVSGGVSLTPTILIVTAAPGGVPTLSAVGTTLVAGNSGVYTTPPVTSYTTLSWTTSGGGTGLTLSGQYDANSVLAVPIAGGCINVSSGGPVTATLTGVFNKLCLSQYGTTIGGYNNSISGAPAGARDVEIGDFHNSLGSNNVLMGTYVYDYAQVNTMLFSSGSFLGLGAGKSQTAWTILRNSGTASLRLTANYAAAGTQNTLNVSASELMIVRFVGQAIDQTSAANWATWDSIRVVTLQRGSSGNVSSVGNTYTSVAPDHSGGTGSSASLTVSADTTNQGVNFTISLPGSDTWHGQVSLQHDDLL